MRDLAELSAWYRLHPKATQRELAGHFQIPLQWVQRHWKEITAAPPPEVHLHIGPRLVVDPGTAGPAAGLTASDREMALGTVRRIYRAIRISIDRLLTQLENQAEDAMPRIEVTLTQALLNLQRVAQSMVDAHPGLLQLSGEDGDDQSREVSEEELQAHLAAIERGSM